MAYIIYLRVFPLFRSFIAFVDGWDQISVIERTGFYYKASFPVSRIWSIFTEKKFAVGVHYSSKLYFSVCGNYIETNFFEKILLTKVCRQ
jgi:hypothetical protein